MVKIRFNYTVLTLVPFNKKLEIWFAIISATTIEASVVDAAIWGVNIKLGVLNKILSLAGSSEKTSRAAPLIKPFSSDIFRSCSKMSSDLDRFQCSELF